MRECLTVTRHSGRICFPSEPGRQTGEMVANVFEARVHWLKGFAHQNITSDSASTPTVYNILSAREPTDEPQGVPVTSSLNWHLASLLGGIPVRGAMHPAAPRCRTAARKS